LYPCTVCGIEFENRNSMANHVRWKHKEKKFSDEGYANIKRTAFKRVNEERQKKRGHAVTIFRPCPKCKKMFTIKTFSKHFKKTQKFCSQSCANSHGPECYSDELRKRLRESALKNIIWANNIGNASRSNRFSSRAERELAEKLGEGFRRHLNVKTGAITFDVDIASHDGRIWIESDGPYHFGKVHRNHDFEKSMTRDATELQEAISRNVLLIRVNNTKYTIDEQIEFVNDSISSWDGTASVRFLY